jgi:putative acetyltransferase
MHIEIDNITRPEVLALLREHLRNMHEVSPPQSIHALDISGLKVPEITFWTAWEAGVLMGCGALKELSADHGEVKSMRTPQALRGRGVGRALLAHIVSVAHARNYRILSLETGAQAAFAPALRLYESVGFTRCAPFASYVDDPNSVFMSLRLDAEGAR